MRALRHGGALIGVGPPATLGNESPPEGAEKREGENRGSFYGPHRCSGDGVATGRRL
jgi:hypothetical protein